MNTGGEASEQVVKIMLEGTEVALRLTGSATKNLAGLLYTHFKDTNKQKGKTGMGRLLKEGKELRIFRIEQDDLKEFKVQAKKYGILYTAIKDKKSVDTLCDVIIKASDTTKANHVLGKMSYSIATTENMPVISKEEDPKKDHQQRTSSSMQNSNSMPNEKTIPKVDIEQVVKDFKAGNKNAVTPENWKAYLNLQSQMYSYSPKNKERIFEQNSSASVVMSKTKWREVGRYPKQGAKGILISMPEFNNGNRTGRFVDAKVYDVSETYGKEIGKLNFSIQLVNKSEEIKSEIDRMVKTMPVPVEYVAELETDSYYDEKVKKIYVRSDLCDTDKYKALCLEHSYAQSHTEQGDKYLRGNNRLTAESIAFAMASKYSIDTSEYTFDYIPDVVNGNDDDLNEIINPIVKKSTDGIKKSEKNLNKFKSNEKPSIMDELKRHKSAIESNTYQVTGTKQLNSKVKNR